MTAKPDSQQYAFVLEHEDRFHSILVSHSIRFEVQPDAETVITFFVLRRATGLYDIVNVVKTFRKEECVSRKVHVKPGIPQDSIQKEIADLSRVFAKGIEDKTGFRLTWDTLDLSGVEDRQEQFRRIRAGAGGCLWRPGFGLPWHELTHRLFSN